MDSDEGRLFGKLVTPSESHHIEVTLPGSSTAAGRDAACHRVCVYAVCTGLAVCVSYLSGKEMAWDLLNYHFYLGFSALNDRFAQDYFAAGPQSYFNPYAYVPFYTLVRLGLPALMVGTVLAALHSMVLWLTYELALQVGPSTKSKQCFFALCVTILAFLNPILLQQIGSSFSDVTTAELVMGGWLLLVQSVRLPHTGRVVLGAMLLGFAAALKPTNVVHAFSAVVLVAFVPRPPWARIRLLFYFGAALGSSFVLVTTSWSHRLSGMLGDPISPLLARAHRFIPDSLAEALLRPFAIVGTGPMVHEELSAPDIRYALLLLAFLVFMLARLCKSIVGTSIPAVDPKPDPGTRQLVALGCGFAIDWIVWLVGSGNGRYFIPMACVAAVLSVALLFRLLANHPRGRNGILLALFLAQSAQLALGTDYRWDPAPWDGRWFNVEIPQKLALAPNLYLSIGGPSDSFLVPFLPEKSGFVNVSGYSVLGPDGEPASRVRAMIRRSTPHVRVLVKGEGIYADAARREPRQSDVDDVLRMFGVRVDMSDCETVTVRGLRPSIWRAPDSSIPAPPIPRGKLRYTSYFASCRVVADTRENSQETAARRGVDIVLDHLEDACPAMFQPPRRQTEHINQIWLRRYGATDLTAWIGGGEVKVSDAIRNPVDIELGRVDAWAKGPLPLECGRRNGIYFASPAPDHP